MLLSLLLFISVVLANDNFKITMNSSNEFSHFVSVSRHLLSGSSSLVSPEFRAVVNASPSRIIYSLRSKHSHFNMTIFSPPLDLADRHRLTLHLRSQSHADTFDWVVIASAKHSDFDTTDVVQLLQACRHLTHLGVLLWNTRKFDADAVTQQSEFSSATDYTLITLRFPHAHVFYLKKLLLLQPQRSLPFQARLTDLAVDWNERAVLGTVSFRAHTSDILRKQLTRSSLVIAINSNAAYSERRAAIRETWGDSERLARLGIAMFFTVVATQQSVAEEAIHNDFLLLEAVEGYNLTWSVLTLKSTAARQISMTHAASAKWFYRVDDDAFVHIDNLLSTLGRLRPSPDGSYLGCAFNAVPLRDSIEYSRWNVPTTVFKGHRYPRFMAGGAGFLLSRVASDCLSASEQRADWVHFDIDDVLVRLSLIASCHKVKFLSLCNNFLHAFRADPNHDVVAIHYTTPSDMRMLFAQFNNRTIDAVR
jgi:hypothetical protein